MATKELTVSNGDNVALPMAEHTEHQELCELPAALMDGTEGMVKAAQTYLPKEEGESDAKYAARLKRSTLTNYFKRTIQKMSGEVFGSEVSVSEDVNTEIEELVDNIDNQGNDVTQFIKVVFEEALEKGVNHVLVEYPPVTGKTKAEHKAVGARPYWVEVKSENIIGWRTEIENGRKVLTQVRIKEKTKVADGKYGMKEVDRVRVLTPGAFEVYEKDKEGVWKLAKDEEGNEIAGKTTLDYIPLVTIRLGEKMDHLTCNPPLLDLAHLNRAHWESSSDQRNILHYARLVTYFGKMLDVDDDGKVIFGANRLVHSTSPDADLKIVEHSGAAIASGRDDLKDLESAMALFGLTLMLPKSGDITATEKAVDKGENDSALKGWVRILNGSLKTLLEYTANYLSVDNTGELKANDDFRTILHDVDKNVLIESVKIGFLPKELVYEEFKRRNIITQDVDWQAVLDMHSEQQKTGSVMAQDFGKDSGELQGQSPEGPGQEE